MKRAEAENDRKFLELARREMWQKCPICSIYVERHSGCEHIQCRCGCNFCYMCGKFWEHGHLCNKSST
ncbi:hypothetical protein P8452_19787 [Trifolium repens]|nr:hypothetical protein P8452_19787 [Trifolium repens]